MPKENSQAPNNASLPASVTLSQVYSFYAEDGAYLRWGQEQVVENPEEIKLLIERGAPLCF